MILLGVGAFALILSGTAAFHAGVFCGVEFLLRIIVLYNVGRNIKVKDIHFCYMFWPFLYVAEIPITYFLVNLGTTPQILLFNLSFIFQYIFCHLKCALLLKSLFCWLGRV